MRPKLRPHTHGVRTKTRKLGAIVKASLTTQEAGWRRGPALAAAGVFNHPSTVGYVFSGARFPTRSSSAWAMSRFRWCHFGARTRRRLCGSGIPGIPARQARRSPESRRDGQRFAGDLDYFRLAAHTFAGECAADHCALARLAYELRLTGEDTRGHAWGHSGRSGRELGAWSLMRMDCFCDPPPTH